MRMLDDRVVQFALETGLTVHDVEGALRVAFSDTALDVREESGSIKVEKIERGVTEGVDLVTSSWDLVDRFMIQRIGMTWRSRHKMTHVMAPPMDALPGGTVIREELDGGVVLIASVGEARVISTHEARRLARALDFGLDDVIASFRDPQGRPAFSR